MERKPAKQRKVDDATRNKLGQFDRCKTLQQLDGKDWGEPGDVPHFVRECYRLRRVRLEDFTVENLCVMIGQEISLEHLMPLAIERLEADPFVEGDCYGGDLLVSVLKVNIGFWEQNEDWHGKVAGIAAKAEEWVRSSPEALSAPFPRSYCGPSKSFAASIIRS